jgi:hypothetical protein
MDKQLKTSIESILEEEKCAWHLMAADENSTTFDSVKAADTYHPLHRCAYDCDGTFGSCRKYITLSLPKKLKDNYLK